MSDMLDEFEVRHVRGRARCTWNQGHVGRTNQMEDKFDVTHIKMPGRWTIVGEYATYSYITVGYPATGNTPFASTHGLPTRRLMREDRPESILGEFNEN